jgi:hypothetical protein
MATPLLLLLGQQTLNSSADYDVTLGPLTTLNIERNSSTPAGDPVNITFETLSVAALSSISVSHASLSIESLAAVSVATDFSIGDGGRLDLSASTVSLGVLSDISFTGVGGILELGSGLNLNLLGNISGFNSDDVISFNDITSATDVRYESGQIRVYDGNDVVASATINGSFDGDDLGFQSNGQGGINVGVGLGNGGGLPNDVFSTGLHSEYIIAQSPLGQLYLEDKVDGRDSKTTLADATYIVFADGIGRFDSSGAAQDVAHLYQAAFNRRPDASGLDYYTNQLESGAASEKAIAGIFASSAEFTNTYGSLDNNGYISQLYLNVLDRPAEQVGLNYWTNELNTGARSRDEVLLNFADSIENIMNTLDFSGDRSFGHAYRLYEAALDRAPEQSGLDYWYNRIEAGGSLTEAAQGFVDSAEFQGNYGGLDNTAFVNQLYQNVLERPADQVGADYWVGVLQSGGSRGDVLLGFSDSLEARILTADATHDSWVYLGAN